MSGVDPSQGRLDLGPGAVPGRRAAPRRGAPGGRDGAPGGAEGPGGAQVVRVVPDVAGIGRTFDYVVPDRFAGRVDVGTIVRVDLHGRRVAAWVVEVDPDPPAPVELKPLARLTGLGPPADLVDLTTWAAWRWAGRRRSFLAAASPPGRVAARPGPAVAPPGGPGGGRGAPAAGSPPPEQPLPPTGAGSPAAAAPSVGAAGGPVAGPAARPADPVAAALAHPRGVLRLPPGADRYPVVLAALAALPADRDALVLCPSVAEAGALAGRLRRDGRAVAAVAHEQPGVAAAGEWARAAAGGCTVVGARAGAWAPVPRLGRVVVLDEHDEAYQEESSPTWHARAVAGERAARVGAPTLLVSPCPSLEALLWGTLETVGRGEERRGWPSVELVDRRNEDPAAGLFTEPFAALLRQGGRVVCVVNRTGRSRLSACASCREIVACTACEGAMAQPEPGLLVCTRCRASRPVVCAACGATRFRALRPGVSRLREELAALVGEPVDEVTAATARDAAPTSRVVIGTEAALHRVRRADAVAFLDVDQELLAPRERAREQALALLARAARVVRGRSRSGRLLVQTRRPHDVVLQAVLHADPDRVRVAEEETRRDLGLSPFRAVALVSGEAAPALMAALGRPPGVEVQSAAGTWRLRAPSHAVLCDALAAVDRPPGRLRVEVDPLRA